jgi:iron(III) transport system substrate-binding protein
VRRPSLGRFLALGAVLGLMALAACSRPSPAAREVVLYSSVDDPLLRQVADAFTARTGIRVLVVGDTEATKTTGLVERLLAERASARCDVWWSSEAIGTARLAGEGLFEPYLSSAEARVSGGWPRELTGPRTGGAPAWYGFACRARVIAYDARDVAGTEAPRTLRDLTDPRWKGRVGMARPQFGTTRGQMAALAAECGEGALRTWLTEMKRNGLRLYDGNSAVARAVAQGEIDAGLMDTDDAWAAQREGWPVAVAFEAPDGPGAPAGLCSRGALLIPNTVALVRGAPHRAEGAALIDFLLGPEVERLLGESDSHNLPVEGTLPPSLDAFAVPGGWLPDVSAGAARSDAAARACDEVLGTP